MEPAPGNSGADLVTIGESLGLVATRELGPWRLQRSAQLSFGGSESNVAIGVARLGHSVAWIGRVGDDEFGEMITRELTAEGVFVAGTVDPLASTAIMLKERRTSDITRVRYYRTGSAGSRLAPEDLDAGLIAQSRALHLSMITPAVSDSARDAVHEALRIARNAGVSTSLDLNYRKVLWSLDSHREATLTLLPFVDTVFASVEELLSVSDATSVDRGMQGLMTHGPTAVVTTDGARGARYLVGGQSGAVDARPVGVVDTVGAGDAFVAGWLSAQLDCADLATRGRTAVSCGAFACTVLGDWEGAPTRSDLQAFDEETDSVSR
jgi:2-dehydro-3-deoxygluconokinase